MTACSVDIGRKLNVHKTFRRRPGRLLYVQFKPCVYKVKHYIIYLHKEVLRKYYYTIAALYLERQ